MVSLAVPNSYACVVFFLLLSVARVSMLVAADAAERAPILFIFGDSTVDVGTNNFINTTIAKANFPYNGIDFPYSVPTGRFSNGFNTADQIARLLGHKRSPPPFFALEERLFSFKKNILQGVNFASAGSGILRETGRKKWGEVIYLEKQVEQFALVRGNMSEILGPVDAGRCLSEALFVISVGTNDLIDYSNGDSGIGLGKEAYMAFLQLNYYSLIKKLYQLGARKFGIISVPPIGCCPAVRAEKYGQGRGSGCEEELNDLARSFFSATESLFQRVSSELKGMNYSLGNSYLMTINMFQDPLVFGFKDTENACCGFGVFNGEGQCFEGNANVSFCGNRRDHLFWDWFHPTEKASELAALTLYGGGPQLVTPINFRKLATSD